MAIDKKPKFKVGDRVVIDLTGSFPTQGGGGEGTIIRNPDASGWFRVEWDKANQDNYTAEDVILISKKGAKVAVKKTTKTTRINVGDTVKMTKKQGGTPSLKVGDIGVVTGVLGGNEYRIDYPAQRGYQASKDAFEKVKKGVTVTTAPGTTPKVGDRMRCINTNAVTQEGRYGGGGWKNGLEFTIKSITEVGKGELLYWSKEGPGMGIYASWTEPVEVVAPKPVDVTIPKKVHLAKHDILGQEKIHKQLEIAVELDMPVLIVGDTGTGKTTIVKSIAEKRKAGYIRFNLTGETTVDEFVGKYVLLNEETVWEDGILLTAMKQGKWLIVDEVNVALPEILFVLHSLLDDDRSVMVSNHKGEVIKPHEDFRFFGTMNPVDEYAGTKDLNKAFKSRFGMILNMEYPNPAVETQIVQSKANVEMEHAVKIVDVAQKIRKAKQANEVFYTCSTRDAIQWGTLVEKLGLQDAFEVAILNKANGDREMVRKIFTTVCGAYKQAAKDGHELNLETLIKMNAKIEADKQELVKTKSDIEKHVRERLLKTLMDNGDKKAAQGVK